MKLHTLQPAAGSTKNRKRIGRGTGSGRGGTSTRGHKGAKSRSGYKTKIGFEGGQMPLQRRVPKFGFKSLNRVEFKPVNLDTLQSLAEQFKLDTIDMEAMISHGIASKNDKVKVLGGGELSSKLTVSAHGFSASAVAAIEKAGGSVNKI
ncbi:50S ribosomal protein L15 [Algoriphagus sp. CAU 1675]|uniref:50S ribosomal protein L15 n=1 Tax=Algoriphagus sp. CAU 1675 TaxID=3032597 RepID=UPI0023DBD5A3|nr:50S ribosomal protein L15 [Algoriphagus sp. CAU 1675]MDF2158700.1 50S ribosomal protein L15 [Algoriphagus sp. CAU 1675]